MKLETHEGFYADPAEVGDVERAVAGLTQIGEAFVVLSDETGGDETYVQAAGSIAEDFIVERRDGRAGEHYRGDRRVSASELTSLLVAYLQRAPDWSSAIEWHRIRVDAAYNDQRPST